MVVLLKKVIKISQLIQTKQVQLNKLNLKLDHTIMKQTIVFIAALAVSIAGFSQKQPKPNINKANSAREKGELAEAKTIIDQAIVYEKTKDNGKTWYYRALIYATIDTTSNPAFQNLSDNALDVALESFAKAELLGEVDKEYFITNATGLPVSQSQQVDFYYSYYFNKAIVAFEGSEFQSAVDDFYNASKIIPSDSNTYKNAAYAAHNGELFDQAISAYKLAIEKGLRALDMFTNLSNIYIIQEDKEGALVTIQEARKIHPKNKELGKTEINLLIQLDKVEDAKNNLIQAIAAEPENTILLFTLAAMYEELGEKDNAMESYEKAIALEPNQYESNFNRGVILLNDANEVIKEYSNLGVSKADRAKEKQLEPIIKEKLNKALPQWEKLYEIKPNDRQIIETLMYVYNRLKKYDEGEKLDKILEAMGPVKE
jgi:tetratricopeptide (TPR) repeat protein